MSPQRLAGCLPLIAKFKRTATMRNGMRNRVLRLEAIGFSTRENLREALQIKNVIELSLLRSGSGTGSHEEFE